jgi:hypothetical protein
VLYALGEDPGTVMDELGHTDPTLALRVYRHTMRRDEGERAKLAGLIEGGFRHCLDTNGAASMSKPFEREAH